MFLEVNSIVFGYTLESNCSNLLYSSCLAQRFAMRVILAIIFSLVLLSDLRAESATATTAAGADFFERRVRPILVRHCYECHSEDAQTREGGLLLDRESGWLQGGDSGKAVVPGDQDASLLLKAVAWTDPDFQMPPDQKLEQAEIEVLQRWIQTGAPGPKTDLGATEFSRLGNQDFLFQQAEQHWAFQPLHRREPPEVRESVWNRRSIDRFICHKLNEHGLEPAGQTADRTLLRRLYFDLTGLPPTMAAVNQFEADARKNRPTAVAAVVDELLASDAFGERMAQLWLDVARYADTDSSYRPDTKTPHYYPFAYTYRDYVVEAFNSDKPFDQFLREQLAVDLMGFEPSAPEIAALGFLTTGPHANRSPTESIDDWIDLTTRGLMGLTAACARCHDHKYEPIPTADYYALHGVFASIRRLDELDETNLPLLSHYQATEQDTADYRDKRAVVDRKIKAAAGKKSGGNNRSVSEKIRETELAELLLFHPGAPAHTMVVQETKKPVDSAILIRGDASNRGERVPRRFLTRLDPDQTPFSPQNSGRLELANRIASPDNPLTARVFVNRVWGLLTGAHIVATPSDFGLQGAAPTHPELLDWLTADFIDHDWSTKHLARTIVLTRTYQQRSDHRDEAAAIDPQNTLLWRANRKHLSIEAIRDAILSVSDQLDRSVGGHPRQLWGADYSRRRAIYGFVNRFNLDPTLRAFGFPSRMQTHSERSESIVAPQALFTMNSPFVIDQAIAVTQLSRFQAAVDAKDRSHALFETILQRPPAPPEVLRITRFTQQQHRLFEQPRKNSNVTNPWPLVAQALLMSNEFQYLD